MRNVGEHGLAAAAVALSSWLVGLPDAYKAFGFLMVVDMVAALSAAAQRQDGSITMSKCFRGVMKKISMVSVLVSLEIAGRWLGVPRDLAPWVAAVCAGHEILSILRHGRGAMPEWILKAIEDRLKPSIEKSTTIEEKR